LIRGHKRCGAAIDFFPPVWPIALSEQAIPDAHIDSLTNICFMGTTVVSGSATGVIALTGGRALVAMLVMYLVLTHLMKVWFHRRFGLD
jgi:magnesium-transporting ATPase (P-type)